MAPHQTDADRQRAADLLRDYYLQWYRLLDRTMSAEGASFARTRMLMHVAREEPVRSIDLATLLAVTPRTVTEAVDGLERDGLVRRDPDADDRRAKRITTTAAGRAVIERAEAARRRYVDGVFDALTPAELAEAIRLIGKLVDRLRVLET